MIKIIKYPDKNKWKEILKRPAIDSVSLEETVSSILRNVKENSDSALREYAVKFDNVQLNSLQVSEKEINDSENKLNTELKESIQIAKNNIEKFHISQKEESKIVETSNGVLCTLIIRVV